MYCRPQGERLSQVRDTKLVEIGVEFSLTQLLDSGFYHADPHPGNLLRTPDGKLAYLDFGMMGEMDVSAVQSGAVQYSTSSTVQHSTVRYSTV